MTSIYVARKAKVAAPMLLNMEIKGRIINNAFGTFVSSYPRQQGEVDIYVGLFMDHTGECVDEPLYIFHEDSYGIFAVGLAFSYEPSSEVDIIATSGVKTLSSHCNNIVRPDNCTVEPSCYWNEYSGCKLRPEGAQFNRYPLHEDPVVLQTLAQTGGGSEEKIADIVDVGKLVKEGKKFQEESEDFQIVEDDWRSIKEGNDELTMITVMDMMKSSDISDKGSKKLKDMFRAIFPNASEELL